MRAIVLNTSYIGIMLFKFFKEFNIYYHKFIISMYTCIVQKNMNV